LPVIYYQPVDASKLPNSAIAETHLLCIEIDDVHQCALDLITFISDTSWISQLDSVGQMSYEEAANETIQALVQIFQAVQNNVTEEFGEYMVSLSAIEALRGTFAHTVFPLSELWKEKMLGNHGFDFHSQSAGDRISFGEAKYKKHINPYTDATKQVIKFIGQGKDRRDAAHLVHFASPSAIENLNNRVRGFAVAFSLHSPDHAVILKNALESELIQQLSTMCHELYVIGVRA